MTTRRSSLPFVGLGYCVWALAAAVPLQAETTAVDPAALHQLRVGLDTVWVLVAGMLVFFMNAGFAMLESGLCRAKNTVNVLTKNFIVMAIASVAFWLVGWGLMYGGGNAVAGWRGLFCLAGDDQSPAVTAAHAAVSPFSPAVYAGDYAAAAHAPVPLYAKFFFQLMFAGTAATIVSGAVAERIRFGAFLLFSLLLVALVYPLAGRWVWGGGFLQQWGFRDYAGATVVHSVGGWAALAGVMVLGPRRGKFREGRVHPIPGHNLTSATLGAFILWLGWFGFSPGAAMAVRDGAGLAHVVVFTNLAGAAGALAAMGLAWVLLRKPDLSMILNGGLAGLVASTAACGFAPVPAALAIGLVAGALAVLAILFFDKLQLDDPVGALSVHLVGGIWGTLAAGLFYRSAIAATVAGPGADTGLGVAGQVLRQGAGVAVVGAFAFGASWLLWQFVKRVTGLRVDEETEAEGLDVSTHGNEAYPDFSSTR